MDATPTTDTTLIDAAAGDATPTTDTTLIDAANTDTTDTTATPGAPESYEFSAPEGVTLDEAMVGKFSEFAKTLNLPQEKAQELLNLHIEQTAAQLSKYTEINKQWVEQAKADKEFGGADFTKNMANVAKANKNFGSPELTQLLNQSGLGNNPEIIRFMYRVGKAMGEDTLHRGNPATPTASKASSIYNNTKLND